MQTLQRFQAQLKRAALLVSRPDGCVGGFVVLARGGNRALSRRALLGVRSEVTVVAGERGAQLADDLLQSLRRRLVLCYLALATLDVV